MLIFANLLNIKLHSEMQLLATFLYGLGLEICDSSITRNSVFVLKFSITWEEVINLKLYCHLWKGNDVETIEVVSFWSFTSLKAWVARLFESEECLMVSIY